MAKDVDRAEKDREQISNRARDLLDQRADLRIEISKMEQEFDQLKKEEREIGSLWSMSF